MPNRFRLTLSALSTTLLLSACGAGGGSAPAMPAAYSERLGQAWQAAGQGENPTQACAIVTGLAVGRTGQADSERSDAQRAFELCYVDIPARYLQTRLTSGKGNEGCATVPVFMITQRMSLGTFADDLGMDRSALDTRLRDQIAGPVRSTCPDLADSILGP